MKAFIAKNFRQLSLERKIIFFVHILTLFGCVCPWVAGQPLYEAPFAHNAFGGAHFLLGFLVFLISAGVVLFFVDEIFETQKLKIKVRENFLFFAAGGQNLILTIGAWSVIFAFSREFVDTEIRFGIFIVFLAQIVGLVATYLNYQNEKQKKVHHFFNAPKSDVPENKPK